MPSSTQRDVVKICTGNYLGCDTMDVCTAHCLQLDVVHVHSVHHLELDVAAICTVHHPELDVVDICTAPALCHMYIKAPSVTRGDAERRLALSWEYPSCSVPPHGCCCLTPGLFLTAMPPAPTPHSTVAWLSPSYTSGTSQLLFPSQALLNPILFNRRIFTD